LDQRLVDDEIERQIMMLRRDTIRCGIGQCGVGLTTAALPMGPLNAAAAESAQVLKTADLHPPGYPSVVALEHMGEKLAAATDGRLKLFVYTSMQLGGEKEEIEQAQVGALAMVRVSAGPLGDVVDDLNVLNLPFLFRDAAQARRVLDGPIGQELLDRVSNHPTAGLIGLTWFDTGAHGFYDTRRPIRSMADLSGLKIRVMGNPIFVDMINAMGGNGVPMGYDQVVSALRTGVVDGAENSTTGYVFDNHYEVAKYFTLTEHLVVPAIVVFSKPVWIGLASDDRELIKRLAREARAEQLALWDAYEAQALARMRQAGITIETMADEQSLRAAVKPIWQRYAPRYADVIARIQAQP
jgi:tripartite ATP-independent transporter DctP family solute receptor